MPAPSEPQQNGWVALISATIGALSASVAAAFVYAGNRYVAFVNRKTAVEVKQADRESAYADDVREDLKALRAEFRDQQSATDALRKEIDAERRSSIQKDGQIALHEIEIAELKRQLAIMQDEKRKTQQEYEAEVTGLNKELVDKTRYYEAEMARANAEIVRLTQQIMDHQSVSGK